MNKYNLVSIVRPTADDTVVESIHKSITDVISSGGGSVSEQGVWQKRKLAYEIDTFKEGIYTITTCLLYTSPSPRDLSTSRMPSSA